MCTIPCGLVVRIQPSHGCGRGSIPRMGMFFFSFFYFYFLHTFSVPPLKRFFFVFFFCILNINLLYNKMNTKYVSMYMLHVHTKDEVNVLNKLEGTLA